MSFRKALPVTLSPKARQDVVDILRYTGETWGVMQLGTYREKLDAALQAISQNPQLGHRRSDLPPSLLAYPVGSHIVIYRPDQDGIGVVRVLHQRMSLPRHV